MQNNIEYIEVDLLKETPSQSELEYLAGLNKLELRDLVNKKSQAFRKTKADLQAMNDEAIVSLIYDNPRIMIRPILTDGTRLILGFDEERYTGIFQN